jgi:hypothetical protein
LGKWVFDGEGRRTKELNRAATIIYQLNNRLRHKKTGAKIEKNLNSGEVLVENLLSHSFLMDMERLSNIAAGTVAEPLSRDFKKKYQRRFTQKESPELPLSKIYEMYGCGYLNKKKSKE